MANSPSDPDPPSGAMVILVLFLFLAFACTGALAIFASMTDPAYRFRIYVSMAANILLASGAIAVFVSMDLRRRGVIRWWLALATCWIPAVNLFMAWRENRRYANYAAA